MTKTRRTLQLLNMWGCKARLLTGRERAACISKWKRAFLVPVPKVIGLKSIYHQYFHTFSYGLTPCLEKKAAYNSYARQMLTNWTIIIWDGNPVRVLACKGRKPTAVQLEALRDVQQSFADIHLTSADFNWTFCVTHEPKIGPYYSEPSKGWRSKLTVGEVKRRLGRKMIAYLNRKSR